VTQDNLSLPVEKPPEVAGTGRQYPTLVAEQLFCLLSEVSQISDFQLGVTLAPMGPLAISGDLFDAITGVGEIHTHTHTHTHDIKQRRWVI
jgi:hypothetical protein